MASFPVLFLLLHLLPAAGAGAVQINNLLVSAVKTGSATLNWDSTQAYTAWVEYGPTASYGNSTTSAGLEYFSQVELAGLAEGTLYHYRIHSADYLGQEEISTDYTFTTRTQAEVEAAIRAARADGGLPKTYYVKPGGDDSRSGLSLENAWRSPAQAVGKADVGDTIYLTAGIWIDEWIKFAKSGIDVAPITLAGGYGGGQTILDSTLNTPNAITASFKDYLNIRDLTLRNYGYAGYLYQITRVNLTRVTAEDSQLDAIWCRTNSRYVHFDQVVINRTGSNCHGIHSHGYPDNPTDPSKPVQDHIRFTGCVLNASTHNGIDLHNNNHYITVAGCTFDRVTNSAAVFSHNYNNLYIMVRDCVFLDGNARGVWICGTDDAFVCDNTFIDSGTYGVLVYRPEKDSTRAYPGTHNLMVKNNVFRNFQTRDTYDISIGNGASDEDDNFSDLKFVGNSVSNKIMFFGQLTQTQNLFFIDPPDTSLKFMVWYANCSITGAAVRFTDNRVVSENAPFDPVYFPASSELSLDGIRAGNTTLQIHPMTARPGSGTAGVTVTAFDATLDKGQTLADFTSDTAASNPMDFVIGGLKAGVTYLVRRDGADYHPVKANARRCLAFSDAEGVARRYTVAETDQAADLETPADTTLASASLLSPLPPLNLSATATNRKISLAWDPPLQDGGAPVTHYNIYRAATPLREVLLQQPVVGAAYEDTNVRHGETYYYQVTAVNAAGESARSQEASAAGICFPGTDKRVWVYPNPYLKGKSNGERVAFINLPKSATLRLYTLSGALLITLTSAADTDGGRVEWNVTDTASGIYLYTVIYPGGVQKGKVCVVK